MIEQTDAGVILRIYVQPGAKKNEIVGLHDGALKIKIQSPPEDGKANEALVQFIAKTLNVPAKQVSLYSGQKSRNKKVLIESSDNQELLIKFSKLGYS